MSPLITGITGHHCGEAAASNLAERPRGRTPRPVSRRAGNSAGNVGATRCCSAPDPAWVRSHQGLLMPVTSDFHLCASKPHPRRCQEPKSSPSQDSGEGGPGQNCVLLTPLQDSWRGDGEVKAGPALGTGSWHMEPDKEHGLSWSFMIRKVGAGTPVEGLGSAWSLLVQGIYRVCGPRRPGWLPLDGHQAQAPETRASDH